MGGQPRGPGTCRSAPDRDRRDLHRVQYSRVLLAPRRERPHRSLRRDHRPEGVLMPGTLAERLAEVRSNIVAACARANRPVDSVTLVAVSKTHPPETLLDAVSC